MKQGRTPVGINGITAENKQYVIFPWSKQGQVSPLAVTRMEGVHFWDADGNRYLDFIAQHVCVNAGHQHPKIVAAIKEQAARLCYAAPSFATEPRGRLARMIAEVAPGDLNKTYFTCGGAESNDYALKIAKMVTGRPKVISRHRSYHGASSGAIALTGEARRAHMEPAMLGVLHAFPPYCYRCSFGQEPETCRRECVSAIEEMIEFENPEFIGAIIVETITGTHLGVPVPPDDYLPRLRALCDKYGILLIADEILMGWGRTGKWFAVDNYGVVPDIMTVSKGVNNASVPLGGVVVSDKIAAFMDTHTLWSGSTYSGHTLACAAGVATLGVYHDEGLVENSARLGVVLADRFADMKRRHPSVGDVRSIGLVGTIELVRDRTTREALGPRGGNDPMAPVRAAVRAGGVHTSIWGNTISLGPPLNITDEQFQEGLDVIDAALDLADEHADATSSDAAAE